MQAVHATSDGPWVPKRLGEQRSREGAYVWQSLWQSGAVVTNGTDAPVEDIDPLPSFYAHCAASMPVHVVHGRKPGPCLLVCAARHGDEAYHELLDPLGDDSESDEPPLM